MWLAALVALFGLRLDGNALLSGLHRVSGCAGAAQPIRAIIQPSEMTILNGSSLPKGVGESNIELDDHPRKFGDRLLIYGVPSDGH